MPSAESILKKFINIKTLPHVAFRLSKMLSEEDTPLKELEEVIKLDPTLVLRLLKLVNSSYYSLRRKVENVTEALVYTGLKNLRNMVIVTALKDVFKTGKKQEVFSRSKLWFHSAAVGICCQMIAERILGKKGEDPFLCGLLHDIGLIIEDQVEPDLFKEMCKTYDPGSGEITQFENQVIGTDHCRVGRLIAINWKLPEEIVAGIKQHHQQRDNIDAGAIHGILRISEYMVARLGYTDLPGMKVTLSPSLEAHVRENISEYKILANELPDEIQKAKEVYELEDV